MKRNGNSFLSSVFVANAISGLILVACSNPPPLGQTVTPKEGGTSTTPAPGQGGATATTTFVFPDSAAVQPVDPLQADASSVPASGDANCGSTQSKLQKKPVDLLLVLDRSSSMTWGMNSSMACNTNSTTCSQRWTTIISSLGTVLTSSPAEVNWGLKFFSSPGGSGSVDRRSTGGNCVVDKGVEVPVAPGNTSKIQTQIATAGNAGHTPTRLAIDNSVEYLKTVEDGNTKFILLATDGEPNCIPGDKDTTATDLDGTKIAIANAAAAGFKVFVLGVGKEVANLTGLAQAGGFGKFYSATTHEELSAALASIVGTVAAGCTYQLPSPPVAPNAVGVFADKSMIPQSDSNGWSYAPSSNTTININGAYCEDLKAGKKTLVEIFLPCKATDPIPAKII